MAVHNGERFLHAAVDSLLKQIFTDFELIIVDDASTDATAAILDTYADRRIVRLRTERNLRAAGARNYGISIARGEYLAIHDADDISYPGRLAAQVRFMQDHPAIGLLGSAYDVIDETGATLATIATPTTDSEVRWGLLFGNPLCQSTIMIRRHEVLRDRTLYSESPAIADVFVEDYEAWTRIMRVTKAANLAEPLIGYRIHGANMSVAHERGMSEQARRITQQEIQRLAPYLDLSDSDIASLQHCHRAKDLRKQDLKTCAKMFDLFQAFHGADQVDATGAAHLQQEWMRTFIQRLPVRFWYEFAASGLLKAFWTNDEAVTATSLAQLLPSRLANKLSR